MTAKEIRTNRIVLVDSHDQERGVIGFLDNDELISIDLFGKNGGIASLSVDDTGIASLRLDGPKGNTGVAIGVKDEEGGGGAWFCDREGRPNIMLGHDESGRPYLKLYLDGELRNLVDGLK